MSIVKKHKEVTTGMTNLMNHMSNDYNSWSRSGTEKRTDVAKIKVEMEKEYANGLDYEVNTKYIKVISSTRSNRSVCCFVVITENDKKFRFGDVLKPAGWGTPARNFARGNILENNFCGLKWTGC